MTRYLLDTNIISDVFRNPGGQVDQALRLHSGENIGTSLIVKGEILFGLKSNNNLQGRRRLEVFLQSIDVWSLDDPVDDLYGDLRATVERRGDSMGANDLWIAAHAMALDAVVVTDDRAFLRMPGVKVENWLRETPAGRE